MEPEDVPDHVVRAFENFDFNETNYLEDDPDYCMWIVNMWLRSAPFTDRPEYTYFDRDREQLEQQRRW
jgi:hypothetical protein